MESKFLNKISFSLLAFVLIFRCAYFNTFYNAEKSFESAQKIIENSQVLDDSKIPSEAQILLDKTIENSKIVIQKYPDSNYIDKAHLLIGISLFYQKQYELSIKNLEKAILSTDSKISIKANLFIAFSFLRLKNNDKVFFYINRIKESELDKESLYTYFLIKAEIMENKESFQESYDFYQSASTTTTKESRKNFALRKLIKLAEQNEDTESEIKFIEFLIENLDDLNKIKDLKIDWIESKIKLELFDDVIQDIDNIIEDPNYSSIKPKLLIYKARAYKDSNRLNLAIEVLNDLCDNFSKKNETSEAYYILSTISLFEDYNLELAKTYIDKSIDERSRSKYAKKARFLKEKIDKFEGLQEDYFFYQKNTIDDLPLKNEMNMSIPQPAEIKLDSLLFSMGQIFYFDFNQIDSALFRYEHLLLKFPETKYKKQINNILSYHNDGFKLETSNSLQQNIDSLTTIRNEVFNLKTNDSKLKFYKDMYLEYADSISLFNYAYISDFYNYDLNEAIPIYLKIQDSIPNHPSIEFINNRLIDIKNNIIDLKRLNSQKILLNSTFKMIAENNYDSAKTLIQSIEVRRTEQIYPAISHLIKKLNDYNNLLENKNLNSDSVVYHMAEIDFFDFDNKDAGIQKFKYLIEDYDSSLYINQSKWVLNNYTSKYNYENINFEFVDTNMVFFDNPLKKINLDELVRKNTLLDELNNHFENRE
tara:strand:+ start:71 stop:2185 length:2115 start_codon:yes stop_codon:yes gene_type:complete